MRKLSDLIKESEGSKTYKALVTVKMEVTVVASSEGDAGYKIDAEVNKIPGVISHDIDEIEETEAAAINKDLTFDENDFPATPYGTNHLEDQGASLGDYVMSTDGLARDEIYCIVDTGLNEWNGGYKFIGTSTESLDEIVYTFEDTLTSPAEEAPEIFEFTESEIEDMIELKQIAFDANKSESKLQENATPGTKVSVVDAEGGEYEVEITEVLDANTFNATISKVVSGNKIVGDTVKIVNNADTGGKTVFGVIEETKIATKIADVVESNVTEAKTNKIPTVAELYLSFLQINKDAIANGEDAIELTDVTFYADQIFNIYFEDAVLVDKSISEADAEAKSKELAEELSKYAVEQGTIL